MKNLKYLFLLLCLAVLGASCSDDEEQGGIVATAPVINALVQNEWTLTQPDGDNDPFLFRINWSKARFSYENGSTAYVENVLYRLEFDLYENNFANPVAVAEIPELYTDIHTVRLNEVVTQLLGADSDAQTSLSFRIKALYDNGQEAISEPLLLSVTPYIHKDGLAIIEGIYLIGGMNGWNTANTDFPLYRNDMDNTNGVYIYTGFFAAESWFKFIPEFALGTQNMFIADGEGILDFGESDGGAFYIADAGYYTVTLDFIEMTWAIAPFDMTDVPEFTIMSPVGDFCNWGNGGSVAEPEMAKSAYDPHQWSIELTFEAGTTVKFRPEHNWAPNWGGAATDFPFGKGVIDGAGAAVPAGTYKIYFNDLTAHYWLQAIQE